MTRHHLVLALGLLVGWASMPENAWPKGKKKGKRQAKTAAELQVVDCLLPGKLKRLGRRSQFLTARLPIRTTAVDCEIRGGEYTAYDRASYATALAVWLPAAEAGDAKAQTYVGEIFEKGLAQTPDYAAATTWYRKAAEQGDTRARINLGHLYEKGLGVPLDPATALEWYRRAAGIEEAVVLDWTQQEAQLRQESEELRRALDATEQQLDDALTELETARGEAAELRRRLGEARRAGAGAEAEAEELSSRLRDSEARVEAIQRSIRDYRDRFAQIEARRSSAAEIAGPAIRIVEPEPLSTRGPSIVTVPSGLHDVEITGRVTAPAGLRQLTVAGEVQDVDEDGFFRWTATATARSTLRIEAVDARGKTALKEIVVEPGHRGEALAAEPPVEIARQRRPSPDLHALILSVAEYDHLEPLKTVHADTRAVERLLAEKYSFQTTLIEDPTQFEILRAIQEMAERLEEKDHLLIYYAGHGQIRAGKGYWIGADGAADDPARWIANEAVSDQLDVIRARHVLVVSDSCYSGTLTRSGVARADAENLARLSDKRSRTVLTSGGLQPVLDEGAGGVSIFARAFLRVLEINQELLPGTELHREIAGRVRHAARLLGFRQIPDYAPIQYAGHEAGDFVLLPRAGN